MSIAEDVIEGVQCSHCGVCFEKEHGYPVLCDSCYKEQKKDIKRINLIKTVYPVPKHIYKEL